VYNVSKGEIVSYTQVKAFNQAKGGKVKYFCLRNVRLGYGIPAKYDTAWQAWGKTKQHKNRNVPKLDVPLYYSYITTLDGVRKNYGHIAVKLANGKVWSDGKTYTNSASLEKAMPAIKYVGWGESVNEVKVIKEEEDMYKGHSGKYWYQQYIHKTKVSKVWRSRYAGIVGKIKSLIGGLK